MMDWALENRMSTSAVREIRTRKSESMEIKRGKINQRGGKGVDERNKEMKMLRRME